LPPACGRARSADATPLSTPATTADGRRLAVGSWKGVTIFDLETGKIVQHMNCEMENSIGGLSRLAISPDGTRVAHVMGGCQIGVRDTASGKGLYTLGKVPRGLQAP